MRLLVGIALVCGAASLVHAQALTPAGGDSGSVVAPLDPTPPHLTRVSVQPMNGSQEWPGYLLSLGPNTLTLLVNGHRLELPLERVRRMQTPGDTVRNGARIGAIVAGLWCAFVCRHGLDGASHWPAAVAFTAGMGAAIGVGIDTAIPRRTTIYCRSMPPRSVADADRTAVLVRFRFWFRTRKATPLERPQ